MEMNVSSGLPAGKGQSSREGERQDTHQTDVRTKNKNKKEEKKKKTRVESSREDETKKKREEEQERPTQSKTLFETFY